MKFDGELIILFKFNFFFVIEIYEKTRSCVYEITNSVRDSSKMKVGLHCLVHAKSQIIGNYFNTHGTPIQPEKIDGACFEGIIIDVPREFVLPLNKANKFWVVRIAALSKTTKPFYVDAGLVDKYFCTDFCEPDGWDVLDRYEMETLYRIFDARNTWIKDLKTPEKTSEFVASDVESTIDDDDDEDEAEDEAEDDYRRFV